MSVEEMLRAATQVGPQRKLPGAVIVAADNKGNTRQIIAGSNSLDSTKASPLTLDSTFWLASSSKLLTTIAALQSVERGEVHLDEDISAILPEWKSPDILTGFRDGGEPILAKATKPITLRRLLSHSSGMGYDFASPDVKKWLDWTKANSSGEADPYLVPLLFEPGEGWCYGPGVEWAGRMVERVTGSKSLGNYMKSHIWEPLDMNSTGFRLSENHNIQRNLVETTVKTSTGELIPGKPMFPENPKHDSGGGGLYGSASDYIKILTTLLKNDGKVLKTETVRLMFAPQLSDTKRLLRAFEHPQIGPMFRSGVESTAWDYGLGGAINTDSVEGVCYGSTLSWNGVPNIFWWIDPTAGNCGLYFSQLFPPSDSTSLEIYLAFRKSVFKDGVKS